MNSEYAVFRLTTDPIFSHVVVSIHFDRRTDDGVEATVISKHYSQHDADAACDLLKLKAFAASEARKE